MDINSNIELLIKFNLKIFFLSFFIFSNCSESDETVNNDDNLSYRFSFGVSGEAALMNPTSMDTDKKTSIFVSDPGASQVYHFDLSGNFIKKIGSPGQGPEEFLHQSVISYSNNRLHVQDQSNMRMFIIDEEGNFKKIIPQETRAFVSFCVNNDRYIGFAPVSFLKANDLESDFLFHVFDDEWNLIHQFGKYIVEPENIPAGMSWPFFTIENEMLFSVFAYFPLLQIYNLDGKLVSSFNLDEINNLDIDHRNYSNTSYSDRNRPNIQAVNRSIDVAGNEIFVMRWEQTLTIDKYYLDGNVLKLINTYRYSLTNENYYPLDFFFIQEKNQFYVLELNNEGIPRISVYSLII